MLSIGLIGFGNMAKALAKSWSHDQRYQLHASSPSLPMGVNEDGIITYPDNTALASQCDVIILAVKPYQAALVCKQIASFLKENSVVVSVIAGLNLATLKSLFNPKQSIIRAMPNLPVAKKMGATPLCAEHDASIQHKNIIEQLFLSVGLITWVNSDDIIDRMTAISGSGPAYVLYFLESLIAAGESLDLSKDVVKKFVVQTMSGTLELLKDFDGNLLDLRQQITSKGGTTEAAISTLKAADFTASIQAAILAAYNRAKELS